MRRLYWESLELRCEVVAVLQATTDTSSCFLSGWSSGLVSLSLAGRIARGSAGLAAGMIKSSGISDRVNWRWGKAALLKMIVVIAFEEVGVKRGK